MEDRNLQSLSPVDGSAPPPSRVLCVTVVVFYALLTAAALLWTWLRTGGPLPATLPGGDPAGSLALAAGCAVAVAALSALLISRAGPMRDLAFEIRSLLGPLGPRTAACLALASGIGEEALFRGAMQPVCGYVATSLLFGFAHVGPGRRFLVWTVFATLMGFLLGGLLLVTGSLLGPILLHTAVNYLNLRRIARLVPAASSSPEPEVLS